MKINIPQKAAQILKTLNAAGYEAYVVGGCVRDSILGREPGDWDITTSAFPEQVKELFRRTVDTGIQHGTVTVMMDKEGFEVTTYRVDGEYHDGRHPDAVTFTRSLEEDLKRRDFTINAMAYHPEHGLVDLFGGMEENHPVRRQSGGTFYRGCPSYAPRSAFFRTAWIYRGRKYKGGTGTNVRKSGTCQCRAYPDRACEASGI